MACPAGLGSIVEFAVGDMGSEGGTGRLDLAGREDRQQFRMDHGNHPRVGELQVGVAMMLAHPPDDPLPDGQNLFQLGSDEQGAMKGEIMIENRRLVAPVTGYLKGVEDRLAGHLEHWNAVRKD